VGYKKNDDDDDNDNDDMLLFEYTNCVFFQADQKITFAINLEFHSGYIIWVYFVSFSHFISNWYLYLVGSHLSFFVK